MADDVGRGVNGRGGLRISTHYSLGLFVGISSNLNLNCDPHAIVSNAARTSLTTVLGSSMEQIIAMLLHCEEVRSP
jgi:hypothetical protein